MVIKRGIKLKKKISQSNYLFDKAKKCIPGGVNSPVRAFNAVGGTPRFMERAEGDRLYDVDGNEVADANVLSKIAQMQQAKDEAKEVEASRRKAVDTKDVDALRMMIATFDAEKAAEAMKNA